MFVYSKPRPFLEASPESNVNEIKLGSHNLFVQVGAGYKCDLNVRPRDGFDVYIVYKKISHVFAIENDKITCFTPSVSMHYKRHDFANGDVAICFPSAIDTPVFFDPSAEPRVFTMEEKTVRVFADSNAEMKELRIQQISPYRTLLVEIGDQSFEVRTSSMDPYVAEKVSKTSDIVYRLSAQYILNRTKCYNVLFTRNKSRYEIETDTETGSKLNPTAAPVPAAPLTSPVLIMQDHVVMVQLKLGDLDLFLHLCADYNFKIVDRQERSLCFDYNGVRYTLDNKYGGIQDTTGNQSNYGWVNIGTREAHMIFRGSKQVRVGGRFTTDMIRSGATLSFSK